MEKKKEGVLGKADEIATDWLVEIKDCTFNESYIMTHNL